MRKLILTLLTLVSVNVSAQIECTAIYDFTAPDSFNPSVTPPAYVGERIRIDDQSEYGYFENGAIRIDFSNISNPIGAYIAKEISGDVYLELNRNSTMRVTAVNDATINSISFSNDSFLGNLNPTTEDEYKGEWYFSSRLWEANPEKSVNNLTFLSAGRASEIKQITVNYTLPIVMLVPDASLTNNDVLPSFKDMTLTFEKDIEVLDASKISFRGKNVQLTATADKNVVTLSLDEAIEKAGDYTITVPAGCFQDVEGFQNKELVYAFKVAFNYSSITPAPGKVESVTDGIVITYPDAIGHVDSGVSFTLYKDGEPKAPMYAIKDPENGHNVVLKFKNDIKEIYTEYGEYTIEFPERVVYNAFHEEEENESYNLPFTLTYTIGPDEPVVIPDSETMTKAKELLNISGVGYPAESSAARLALKALVEAEETPTDEELQKAIDDFYAETDITMPESGKYYTISNVNTNGDAIYLAYSNGVVSLTKEKGKAARFGTERKDNGTVAFKTFDGNYLHVLTTANDYDLTTPNNVTTAYNATVNDLKLAKLIVDEAMPEDLFGKMSIYGYLGKNKADNQEVSAYVVVGHDNAAVATDNYGSAPIFGENLSTAFVLEEVETVSLNAELTPTIVTSNTTPLTLKFTSETPVVLANATAYFKDKEGKDVGTASITAVEGKDNEFTVSLVGLVDGTYTLVIPDGTFTTEKDDQTVHVAVLGEMTFTIDVTEAFITEFKPAIYNDKYGFFCDTFFNDFILYSESPMFVDETKKVQLVEYWDTNKPIREGHMELKPGGVEGWPYACQFIFEKPIVAGELEAGQYTLIIEEATVGDANFGKYLADPTSVKKSECKVNPENRFTFFVDNDKAEEPVELVVLEAGFIPKTVESSTDTLLLKFLSDEPVHLANPTAAYIKDKDGNKLPATITAVDGSGVDFIVSWAGLDNGTYDLLLPEATFTTEKDGKTAPVGGLKLTFTIAVTELEEPVIPVVELPAELTPATVSSNTETLTLKFTSEVPVKLTNASAAYFILENSGRETASITAVEGSNVEFTVSLAGLADGTYTLVLPEATFTTEEDGKIANVAAMMKVFTIDSSVIDEFQKDFSVSIYNDKPGYWFDTDLNEFILVSEAPMHADVNKEVRLVHCTETDSVDVRTGYMQPIDLDGHPYAYKLVFDKLIVAGELTAGQYVIILEEATIGDENFGKYLVAPASVKKSQCHVNSRLALTYNVDNYKAAEKISVPAKLTSSTVASNTEKLTLKFTWDAPVEMTDTINAHFEDAEGKNVGIASITKVAGSDTEFTVSLDGLADGTYTLVIPEAKFTTEKEGKPAHVAAMKLTFTIETEEFMKEFWAEIYNEQETYFDTDLNNRILVSRIPMCVDETKEVCLVHCTETDSVVVRTGHMELLPEGVEEKLYACQFVLDEPIETGDLETGKYTIILEEATIGNEKFGQYLADPTSVKKSQCNVNPRLTFDYNVDNKATAITDVNADDNAETVIYTITGRRVKNMNAPGIYIVNGKKVLKK